jgi:hypothetical protein
MPIYNWFKVLKTGNLGYVRKDSTFKMSKDVKSDDNVEALKKWYELNDQFIDEFGQSDYTLELMEKKRQLGKLMCEFLITGNKFKLTQIEISQGILDGFTEKNEVEVDYNKEIGIVSKHTGLINPKKTSVYEYHCAKKALNNGN